MNQGVAVKVLQKKLLWPRMIKLSLDPGLALTSFLSLPNYWKLFFVIFLTIPFNAKLNSGNRFK